MTDPLRYYISEGFVSIFYYPHPDALGKFLGEYESDPVLKYKIKNEGHTLFVDLNQYIAAYTINNKFFTDYGISCASKQDMQYKLKQYRFEHAARTLCHSIILKELASS